MITAADIRNERMRKIFEFFCANDGVKFGTKELHDRFGSAFRSRVADLRKIAELPIVIKNEVRVVQRGDGGIEKSWYWSERRVRETPVQITMEGFPGGNENEQHNRY